MFPFVCWPLSSAGGNPYGGCKSWKQDIKSNGFKAKIRLPTASEENHLLIHCLSASWFLYLHLTFAHQVSTNTQTGMTKPQNEAVLLSFQREQIETFSITKAITSTILKLLPSDQILHPWNLQVFKNIHKINILWKGLKDFTIFSKVSVLGPDMGLV